MIQLLAIIGSAMWALYQYLDSAERQAQQLASARRIEAQKPFLEKQLGLYFEAAEVAGKLSAWKLNNKQSVANEDRFWQLYWSDLALVGTEEVRDAMGAVGMALHSYKESPENERVHAELDDAIFDLAREIRMAIERGWSTGEWLDAQTAYPAR
jgi:hypothetical protein